ncbi:hypothetical protein [Kribbella endophytica]
MGKTIMYAAVSAHGYVGLPDGGSGPSLVAQGSGVTHLLYDVPRN